MTVRPSSHIQPFFSYHDAKEKEVMFGGSNERISGNLRNDLSFGELSDKQA